MDICMFVPWEREKLQELLKEFNTAREKLLVFLDIIEEEWIEELAHEPLRVEDISDGSHAFRRLDTLMKWISVLNENGIYLEEMDGWDSVDFSEFGYHEPDEKGC
jgi:hypothetical protein